jgi:alpha-N-acetylglucosaminidase
MSTLQRQGAMMVVPRAGQTMRLLLPLLLAAGATATPHRGAAHTTAPVAAMIDRVLPGASAHVALELSTAADCGCEDNALRDPECVALSDLPDGRIGIKATSLSSLSFGFGTYLRTRCNASLTWVKTGGLEPRCAAGSRLPPVGAEASRVYSRSVRWTYYQNVVDSSYSFVWWDFDRWATEIDWMALTGINIALVYTGQEKVLRDVYQQFGVNLSDASGALDYFNGPAYLSWSRGQGQASTGGYDIFRNVSSGGALPPWWFEQQATLGKQQATRMRALGITTILRGEIRAARMHTQS